MDIESKFKTLKNAVKELENVLVAYSGGMDSTLLLKTCVDVLGDDNVIAFIGNAPIFPAKEIEEAKQTASNMGVECVLFDTAILTSKSFVENTKDRCYLCKKNLFDIATQIAKEKRSGLYC